MLPVDCDLAKGIQETDYVVGLGDYPWFCWYTVPKFRALFPQYNDLTDDQLSAAAYAKVNISTSRPNPWRGVGFAVLWALLPPITLLALGCSLIWALRGFRRAN